MTFAFVPWTSGSTGVDLDSFSHFLNTLVHVASPTSPSLGVSLFDLSIPMLLYYLTNVLALLGPTTFLHRLALLPFILFSAYRATTRVDLAAVLSESHAAEIGYLKQVVALGMFTLSTRSVSRTFASRTPVRRAAPARTKRRLLLDAADLTLNLRGIGWNFAEDTKIPAQTRPSSPSAFVTSTAGSLILHVVAFDFILYWCQSFDPATLGSTVGGSIYGPETASTVTRLLRSRSITLLVGLMIYAAIQIGHDTAAIIAVAVFRQAPSEWPPVFDAPWFSTSLSEFWAVRWHQMFRQEFIAVGFKPMQRVGGRVAGVLGAFGVSGLLHFAGMCGMGKGADIRVLLFFLAMGVGVVLECAVWRPIASSRVGGWWGALWTYGWLLAFGPLMSEPWCLAGLVGSVFLPHGMRPSVLVHSLF